MPVFLLLGVNRYCDFFCYCQFHLRLVHSDGDDHGHNRLSGHLPEYFHPVGSPVHVLVIGGDGDFYPGVNPFRGSRPGAGDYQVQQQEFIALILSDRSDSLRALHLPVEVRVGPEARPLTFWATLAS